MTDAIESDNGRNLCNNLKRNPLCGCAENTTVEMHRAAEAGGHLWKLPSPTLCSKQCHLQRHCLGSCPAGVCICSDTDWTASLGCLWQCSSTPTEGEKTPEVIFFLFKKNVLYFNLCPFTAFASHISLHSQNRFLAKVYSAGKIKNSYKKCTCFSSEGDKVHLSHQPRYLYYWTYHNPYETKIVSYSLQCTWRIPCLYTEIKGIICQWRLE